LAQVDSSVGGKTAIDTVHGKNLIGLFYQPRLVLADTAVLNTLPDREMGAGLAEVVKYGLINDPAFFDWCITHAAALRARDNALMVKAVQHCVGAKAAIVAADETETGDRALLNLGHTFGHAIEALSGMDGAVLHGEAVAIGMALAFDFSAVLGLCAGEEALRVRDGLAALHLLTQAPASVRAAGADAMMMAMAQDKKNEAGRLTLILARGVGQAFIMKDAPRERLRAFLQHQLG
jgi:3-dehydroquinate synthetase